MSPKFLPALMSSSLTPKASTKLFSLFQVHKGSEPKNECNLNDFVRITYSFKVHIKRVCIGWAHLYSLLGRQRQGDLYAVEARMNYREFQAS